jgi:signal transduction histidine kinase
MPTGGDRSERVIVLAPVGRDGELLCRVAQEKGLSCESFPSVESFCVAFRAGSGVAVLTEEALYMDRGRKLSSTVEEQPGWSEVPFVVLTSRGEADSRVNLTLRLMEPLRNVTVIERPVRPTTIVSALQAAIRDRRRQYEVRETLEELQRSNADLERRVDERTSALVAKITELEGFSYSVSHDMRTPLRSIVSNAHIILEEEAERLSRSGREGLLRLSASAMKMAQLVDDLLEFARLGAAEPKRVLCNLSEMVRSIGEELARDQTVCSMQLSIQEDIYAEADARLIGLAVQNLLENACKYRKSGAVAHISFGAEVSGGEPVYFVRDDGIGFDMAYAPKIFRAFERLHRDSEYPGTGIGLANVKRIIERHGGKVWAKAAPGEGATFYFTLGSSSAAISEGPSLL